MSHNGAEVRIRRIKMGMHPYPRYKYPLHVLGPGRSGFMAQEVIEPVDSDMVVRVGDLCRGPPGEEGHGVDEAWALCTDVHVGWAYLGSPGDDGGAWDGDVMPS